MVSTEKYSPLFRHEAIIRQTNVSSPLSSVTCPLLHSTELPFAKCLAILLWEHRISVHDAGRGLFAPIWIYGVWNIFWPHLGQAHAIKDSIKCFRSNWLRHRTSDKFWHRGDYFLLLYPTVSFDNSSVIIMKWENYTESSRMKGLLILHMEARKFNFTWSK